MKLRAAADYERTPLDERVVRNRKHALDVYLLTAMLVDEEIGQARRIAERFTSHREMGKAREDIAVGFAAPDSGACRVAREQLRGQLGEPTTAELDRFCALLREIFQG